jgi:hypothetical protein
MISLVKRQLMRQAALPMLSHSPIALSPSPAAPLVTMFACHVDDSQARRFATAATSTICVVRCFFCRFVCLN